jgi:3-oxoacyl-[acyl-carrier-protein] synthase-3
LLLAAFGAGLTRGAGLIRWGRRVTPLRQSEAELPPCDRTALEILSDAIKYTRR